MTTQICFPSLHCVPDSLYFFYGLTPPTNVPTLCKLRPTVLKQSTVMKQRSNLSMHLLKLLKQPTAVSLVMNGRFGPSAQPASFSAPLDPRESFNPLSLVGGACHPTNASRRRCRVRCHRHSAPVVPFAPTSSPPHCCPFLYPMMPCRSCGKSTANSRGTSRRRWRGRRTRSCPCRLRGSLPSSRRAGEFEIPWAVS